VLVDVLNRTVGVGPLTSEIRLLLASLVLCLPDLDLPALG
jgi:hypothetical protein